MKTHLLTLVLTFSASVQAFAELVETTDGRKLNLGDDGTFSFIEPDVNERDNFAEFIDSFFERHMTEYKQSSIRFMPKVRNLSDSAIVGFKFTTSFQNAFGDEIFKFSGESTERISSNQTSTANIFYVFEDNPFIGDQPYDQLLPLVENGTGRVVTELDAVVLGNGEIKNFE